MSFYDTSLEVIKATFVSREYAKAHMKQSMLTVYREMHQGYRYVSALAESLLRSMNTRFDNHKGTFLQVQHVGFLQLFVCFFTINVLLFEVVQRILFVLYLGECDSRCF